MMRRSILIVLILGMVAATASAQEPPPAPEPSVTLPPDLDRVLRDYEKAWGARDAKALAQIFAEDGWVLPNGGTPVKGRTAIESYYAPHGGPLALRALGYGAEGKVGYIIGAYSGKAGAPDDGKFTLTLRKGPGGRWLIVSDMDNTNRKR